MPFLQPKPRFINMKTTVFVYNHLIYLNENQRYDLFACVPVETTGILIKAKINSKDLEHQSIQEIFCRYLIDCDNHDQGIEIKSGIINIHLPPQEENYEFPIPFQPDGLDKYDLYDLLNRTEGGREELFYTTMSEDFEKNIKSFHKIEIKDEKIFDNSLEFIDFNNPQVA